MTAAELRRRIKRRVDRLPPDRLTVADDFLAYLQARENDEATAELLRIPGFLRQLDAAERQVQRGRLTSAGSLRRKR